MPETKKMINSLKTCFFRSMFQGHASKCSCSCGLLPQTFFAMQPRVRKKYAMNFRADALGGNAAKLTSVQHPSASSDALKRILIGTEKPCASCRQARRQLNRIVNSELLSGNPPASCKQWPRDLETKLTPQTDSLISDRFHPFLPDPE
jgi:hypothetical protein